MKTEKSIAERIKTYEDACKELGLPMYPERIQFMSEDELAYYKLKVIVKALNEGWKADWADASQYKYFPVFEVTSGSNCGLVYVDSNYAFSYAYSNFGSRLAYKSRPLAEYAGEQFIGIYEKFIL